MDLRTAVDGVPFYMDNPSAPNSSIRFYEPVDLKVTDSLHMCVTLLGLHRPRRYNEPSSSRGREYPYLASCPAVSVVRTMYALCSSRVCLYQGTRTSAALASSCSTTPAFLVNMLPLVRRMRLPPLFKHLRDPVTGVVPVELCLRAHVRRLLLVANG